MLVAAELDNAGSPTAFTPLAGMAARVNQPSPGPIRWWRWRTGNSRRARPVASRAAVSLVGERLDRAGGLLQSVLRISSQRLFRSFLEVTRPGAAPASHEPSPSRPIVAMADLADSSDADRLSAVPAGPAAPPPPLPHPHVPMSSSASTPTSATAFSHEPASLSATSQGPAASSIPASTLASNPTPPPPAAGGLMSSGFSAATEEILRRINIASSSMAQGTPGWEAAKKRVLQSMVTSEQFTPSGATPAQDITWSGRGGRGRGNTPSMKVGSARTANSQLPFEESKGAGGRRRGRGRPVGARGRGRGGRRGSKRKRDDSDEDDISEVGKPVQHVSASFGVFHKEALSLASSGHRPDAAAAPLTSSLSPTL
jgi:hypothetical protein